ncbi:FxsB family radical SAM/SPASM domain protein [soil metagenome]
MAIVKIASRCNLNCSYCYVYNKGDEGWKQQPPLMSRPTVEALIEQVRAHCLRHDLDRFHFVFHGGEPLLASPEFLQSFVDSARRHLPSRTRLDFSLQTNGVLLSAGRSRHLKALGIGVGISMDGTRVSHDRWRVDHQNRGSYDRVLAGLEAARGEGLDPGILTVIDIEAEPGEVYAHLKALRPRIVDFLLPQATWDDPPARPFPDAYAKWLLAIFHEWSAEPHAPFRIRLFEQIIRSVLGIAGSLDALGRGLNSILVIETDGSIETVDVLRVCENGITRTRRNVASDTLDDALGDELPMIYYRSSEQLCAICEACSAKEICAGGYLPHRFSRTNRFDNPSVYCDDLKVLIAAIQHWTVGQLPPDIIALTGLRSLLAGA